MRHAFLFSFVLLLLFATQPGAATAWLGFSFRSVQDGIEVVGIHPSSGASEAGLRPGDVVLRAGGSPVLPVSRLKELVASKKAGERLALVYRRNGHEVKTEVVLGERPDDIRAMMGGSALGSKAAKLGDGWYANKELVQKKPKAMLVDFWATWCGPCRITLPKLSALHRRYAAQGLMVAGVSSEDADVLRQAQAREKLPYPLYRDNGTLWNYYRIRAVPTLLLLDSGGYIQRVWEGAPSEAELRTSVQRVLGVQL